MISFSTYLTEAVPPGMEKWVERHKAEMGEPRVYQIAWKVYNSRFEKAVRKAKEKAQKTGEPLKTRLGKHQRYTPKRRREAARDRLRSTDGWAAARDAGHTFKQADVIARKVRKGLVSAPNFR